MNLFSISKDKDQSPSIPEEQSDSKTSIYPWGLIRVLLIALLLGTIVFPAQVAHDDLARILSRTETMIEKGLWLQGGPLYQNTPICPPLLYWLTALATMIFGAHSAYGPLFISVASGTLILLSMYRRVQSLGSKTGANTFWILFGGSFVFLFYARFLSVASLFALVTVLYINAFTRWKEKKYAGIPLQLLCYAAALGLSAGLPGQLIVLASTMLWAMMLDIKRGALLLKPLGITLFSCLVSGAWYASVLGAHGSDAANHMFIGPKLTLKSFDLNDPLMVLGLGLCPWIIFYLPRLLAILGRLKAFSFPNSATRIAWVKSMKPDTPAKEYGLLCYLYLVFLVAGLCVSNSIFSLLFSGLPFLYFLCSKTNRLRGEEKLGNFIYPVVSIGLTTMVIMLCLLILFGSGGTIAVFAAIQQGLINNTKTTTVLILPLLGMIVLSILQSYRIYMRRSTLTIGPASSLLGIQYAIILIILFDLLIPFSRQWHPLLPLVRAIPGNSAVQILGSDSDHVVLRGLLERKHTLRNTIEDVQAGSPLILSDHEFSEHQKALKGIYGSYDIVKRAQADEKDPSELLLIAAVQETVSSVVEKPETVVPETPLPSGLQVPTPSE